MYVYTHICRCRVIWTPFPNSCSIGCQVALNLVPLGPVSPATEPLALQHPQTLRQGEHPELHPSSKPGAAHCMAVVSGLSTSARAWLQCISVCRVKAEI